MNGDLQFLDDVRRKAHELAIARLLERGDAYLPETLTTNGAALALEAIRDALRMAGGRDLTARDAQVICQRIVVARTLLNEIARADALLLDGIPEAAEADVIADLKAGA